MRAYHKQFYRPENLKIIIAGQISPVDVFKALEPLEQQIISKVKLFFWYKWFYISQEIMITLSYTSY